LPADAAERDDLLLRIMGSPDPRQIDGIGGAHPLTSKVAVVAPSGRASSPGQPDAAGEPETDVDYLFLQVGVDAATVSDRQNCGNLLAGVGPFAVERGLVPADPKSTSVRIRMLNTGSVATATFPTPSGKVSYAGSTAISGVPGTAAAVVLEFPPAPSPTDSSPVRNSAGGGGNAAARQQSGRLAGALDRLEPAQRADEQGASLAGGAAGRSVLPTGRVRDAVDGVAVTCVDNGMPVVVVAATDLGCTGYESVAELEGDADLVARVQVLRIKAGELMGLGDVSATTVPKVSLVAAPADGGAICTRTFIPLRVHESIGVLGAVSVATAVLLKGAVGHDLAVLRPATEAGVPGGVGAPAGRARLDIEHPSGSLGVEVEVDAGCDPPRVLRSGVVRTARKLFDGTVFPRPY